MINNFQNFIIPVLMAVGVVWVLIRTQRVRRAGKEVVKRDSQSRQERAVWAWAKVLASTPDATQPGSRTRVELQLEIHTPGTPAYEATATWLVDQEALDFVEVGKEISLKVDPLDLKYVYPNGPWARLVE
jgi:hypothetical protein